MAPRSASLRRDATAALPKGPRDALDGPTGDLVAGERPVAIDEPGDRGQDEGRIRDDDVEAPLETLVGLARQEVALVRDDARQAVEGGIETGEGQGTPADVEGRHGHARPGQEEALDAGAGPEVEGLPARHGSNVTGEQMAGRPRADDEVGMTSLAPQVGGDMEITGAVDAGHRLDVIPDLTGKAEAHDGTALGVAQERRHGRPPQGPARRARRSDR